MGIYKQTDTKHTQVRIEQASSAKNCSEGEMLRHFNALLFILFLYCVLFHLTPTHVIFTPYFSLQAKFLELPAQARMVYGVGILPICLIQLYMILSWE